MRSSTKSSPFIQALIRKPTSYTPIWVMRQAGRYLPEYRAIREKAGTFVNLMKNPELACEVTMQPLRRFPLDAAILFSDILTIPDAMGLGLEFITGEGPKFKHPLQTAAAIDNLPSMINIEEECWYVKAAVEHIVAALSADKPLIGFSGSPWTLATYMVEGGSSKNFHVIKKMMYQHPELLISILDKVTPLVVDYLLMQIRAGVDAVQIFDSWGGILTTHGYIDYSLKFIQKIVTKIREQYSEIPIIIFTKGGGQWLELMAETGANALGLDWTINIENAYSRVGKQVALQGNLDPAVLLGSKAAIKQEVGNILNQINKQSSGHVFNLGHGITPDVNPDNVAFLVDTVHELSVIANHSV